MKIQACLGILIACIILFFGPGNFWSATWLSKWFVLLAIPMSVFIFRVCYKTSFWYFPLLAYLTGGLLYMAAWPTNPYTGTYDIVTVLALQKTAFFGLAEVIAMAAFFVAVKLSIPKLETMWLTVLSAIWVVGVGMTLALPTSGPASAPNNGLYFGNPSMGASLLGCLIPFVVVYFKKFGPFKRGYLGIFASLTFLAIVKTNASVPWGVFGAVVASYIIFQGFKDKVSKLGLALVGTTLAAVLITYGQHKLGGEFWNENGRVEIWQMAFEWFLRHSNSNFGAGYATTGVLLPIQQVITHHYKGDYFIWLHNDWLQLGIEGGVLGMLCVFLALGRLLICTKTSRACFASLMGFVTLGMFNYPLRMPIHCFCLVIICGIAEASKKASETRALTPSPGEKKIDQELAWSDSCI